MRNVVTDEGRAKYAGSNGEGAEAREQLRYFSAGILTT